MANGLQLQCAHYAHRHIQTYSVKVLQEGITRFQLQTQVFRKNVKM